MIGGYFSKALLLSIVISILAWANSRQLLLWQRETRSAAGSQRLRPPESVKCPRNHLTSFSGRVLYFQRSNGQTVIRLRTDENTTERFTLRHPNSDDPAKWFLLKGEPFRPEDWALIEPAKNRLRPKMRAIVWVCDDGSNPIIDWRPSENREQSVPR